MIMNDDHFDSLGAGLRISVIPPVECLNRNAIFLGMRHDSSAHSANIHWMDCFMSVWDRSKELGVEIETWDVLPPGEADVVIGMTPANSKNNAVDQKRKWPHLKAILVTMETALGSRYMLNPRNIAEYDAIMTYNQHLVDNQRYFTYPPRAFHRHRLRTGPPFEQRRTGVLVGSTFLLKYNRMGLMAMRRGWKFSFKDWFDYAFYTGELIRYRARVGRACAVHPSGKFDIFGQGWEIYPETATKCLGVPKESTLDYLGNYRFDFAFENHSSDCSLISERIWDALWADTVPVYRGNKLIDQVIPRECYIDAEQFESPKAMLDWLVKCPKDVWSRYRKAGREFVSGAGVKPYLPEEFAKGFLRTIFRVARASSLPPRHQHET